MYVRTFKCRSKYISVFFEDDGEPVDIMRLQSSGKGILTMDDYSTTDLAHFKAFPREWKELPHKPCFVSIFTDTLHKVSHLHWGAYNEDELTLRTRNVVVPLDCLMDFVSDYLNSHEDYTVDFAYLCEMHGGTHHKISESIWRPDSLFERFAKTWKRYLSEVL